jgi:hypothetical protein
MRPICSWSAAVAVIIVASCAPLPEGEVRSGRAPDGSRVLVLDAAQLSGQHGTLLNLLRSRVTQLRVMAGDACPRLEMRGRRSITGRSDPSIYLDGTHAVNTCLLEQVSVTDLQRVEIYPMGITSRPGYRPSAGGLILLFSRGIDR